MSQSKVIDVMTFVNIAYIFYKTEMSFQKAEQYNKPIFSHLIGLVSVLFSVRLINFWPPGNQPISILDSIKLSV